MKKNTKNTKKALEMNENRAFAIENYNLALQLLSEVKLCTETAFFASFVKSIAQERAEELNAHFSALFESLGENLGRTLGAHTPSPFFEEQAEELEELSKVEQNRTLPISKGVNK